MLCVHATIYQQFIQKNCLCQSRWVCAICSEDHFWPVEMCDMWVNVLPFASRQAVQKAALCQVNCRIVTESYDAHVRLVPNFELWICDISHLFGWQCNFQAVCGPHNGRHGGRRVGWKRKRDITTCCVIFFLNVLIITIGIYAFALCFLFSCLRKRSMFVFCVYSRF